MTRIAVFRATLLALAFEASLRVSVAPLSIAVVPVPAMVAPPSQSRVAPLWAVRVPVPWVVSS